VDSQRDPWITIPANFADGDHIIAAVKGLTPTTVPEALANPATAEAFFGWAFVIFKSVVAQNKPTAMTNKRCKLNFQIFRFVNGLPKRILLCR
jgi:hypothetical protein